MTAQIILLPKACCSPPPMTDYQAQFERVARVLHQHGHARSIEQARAALTNAVINARQPNARA